MIPFMTNAPWSAITTLEEAHLLRRSPLLMGSPGKLRLTGDWSTHERASGRISDIKRGCTGERATSQPGRIRAEVQL